MADKEKDAAAPPAEEGWPGEKEGEFKLPAERKTELERPKEERGWGNRKVEQPKPGEPRKSTVKREAGFGPIYEKTFFDDAVYTSKEGSDDETFVSVLEGKASVEALSGSYNLDEKKAKLTAIKATAKGSVAHGQVDLVQWFGDLIFGEDPKPEPPPATPPAPMAARVGDVTVHGSPLVPGPGSPNVLIGGKPAWRAGADLHLCPFPGPPHGSGPTLAGAASVLINGSPAARAGDYVLEPAGGPDVILLGCATVLIGPQAPPPPPPQPVEKKPEDLPWVKFESIAKGDLISGSADAGLAAEVDLNDMKGSAEAQLGAIASVLKGELPLKIRIRIPYTSAYLGLGVTVEGTLLSAGAEAGAGISYDPTAIKTFELTAGAKVGAGVGGVGVKFGLDVSK